MNAKNFYEQIARHCGISTEKVRQEIQVAIIKAYTNPERDADTLRAQSQVPRKDNIPTPEELILYLQKQI